MRNNKSDPGHVLVNGEWRHVCCSVADSFAALNRRRVAAGLEPLIPKSSLAITEHEAIREWRRRYRLRVVGDRP